MRLNKRKNECVEAIFATLESAGIKPEPLEVTNGGHYRIRWTINGKSRFYFAGVSPSDWRAHKKAVSDVRRMLRADGVAI